MKLPTQHARPENAFSLIEVALALAVFFVATFAILELTTTSLKTAKLLDNATPNPGMAVTDLMITNMIEEGFASGDFGPEYPGYVWERNVYEVGTNGLFQVDVVARATNGSDWASTMAIFLFDPASSGSSTPGIGGTRGMRR